MARSRGASTDNRSALERRARWALLVGVLFAWVAVLGVFAAPSTSRAGDAALDAQDPHDNEPDSDPPEEADTPADDDAGASPDIEDPEERQFVETMVRGGKVEWIVALSKLGELAPEARPAWVVERIVQYLTPPESQESPERSTFLWSSDASDNPLWFAKSGKSSRLGEEVLSRILDVSTSLETVERAETVLRRLA
ncbi:MAG: hypothetical protein KDC38_19945, partial [Planctomycetes bacterium]|nr:hypothetical protein [Planctomycetota bacterium]